MESKRVEEEYQALMEGNLWPVVYQRIGQRCQSYTYTCFEAKKTENKPLNRYRDVNPYDHSRIVIRKEGFVTDYINANLVKMERANRQYILTQGPLVYTSGHFWLMVWEQKSPAIIMLNKIIEKSEIKCHWYWPHEDGEGHKVVYPDVNISIAQVREIDYSYYTIRQLKMTNQETNESRELWHFHYTTWPDFEVPQSPHAFLDFLQRVREYGALDCEGEKGPAIVHCSAGIGRSGTFCLVDSVLVLIENEGQENVDIQDILLEMRRYRMGLIQTSEQLRFSYKAIVEGIKRLDPNYVPPPESLNESIYAVVADEEEAPPPPPPRGESLGRPPARPLPAIPVSASMANVPVGHYLRPMMSPLDRTPSIEWGLYARRRARAIRMAAEGGNAAGHQMGLVPSLASLAAAAAGVEPAEAPAARRASVPTLALQAATVVLNVPLNQYAQPQRLMQQINNFFDPPSVSAADGVPILELDYEALATGYQDTDGSAIDDLSFSDDPALENSAAEPSMEPDISPEDLEEIEFIMDDYINNDENSVEDSSQPEAIGVAVMRNIELSANVESEDEAPPTPPPRERRDTPSPLSSGSTDDVGDDDETTTETTESTENADNVESEMSEEVALRRRRAVEMAERVALMKKRSRDADRWHQLKRSLFKPIAFSVGVGILAVAGALIYAYIKH